MSRLRSLGTWIRLVRNGLHPRSAMRMRRGHYGDIRFRGHPIEGPNRPRLAWMAMHIWGGEYDLPGFVPRRGERVLDLGANVGVFSVLAASRGASVTAVEPHPATFASLERNTAPWSVDCRRAAVVGRVPPSGMVELVEDPRGDTANRLAGDGDRSIPVPAVGLAELLEPGCDLVKMDVEGAEFEILANTPAEALARLPRLVAEVHRERGDPTELRGVLEAAGFEVALAEVADGGADVLLTARSAR